MKGRGGEIYFDQDMAVIHVWYYLRVNSQLFHLNFNSHDWSVEHFVSAWIRAYPDG